MLCHHVPEMERSTMMCHHMKQMDRKQKYIAWTPEAVSTRKRKKHLSPCQGSNTGRPIGNQTLHSLNCSRYRACMTQN
jgi:hypothetical protein